jgi:uncharacterized protein YkwD
MGRRGRRSSAILVALAAAVVVCSLAADAPAQAPPSPRMALVARINALRASHGLSRLRIDRRLERAAAEHNRQMIAYGFFGHESPDGSAFWERVERWYPPRGRGWQVGENLLAGSPGVSMKAVVEYWLASPEHRVVLLAPAWTSVGIGVEHVPSAGGVYEGEPTTFVTADFGRPR